MRIAFIGLGNMGRHMAANLQQAGHQLARPQAHVAHRERNEGEPPEDEEQDRQRRAGWQQGFHGAGSRKRSGCNCRASCS